MTRITSFSGPYHCLSNFYPLKEFVYFANEEYPTVEHAFQAAKTFDKNTRKAIQNASSPTEAKRLGRDCSLRSNWDSLKIGIMFDLIYQKFDYDSNLRKILIDTKSTILIEGNTWGDTFWGKVKQGNVWHGQNWLGVILMQIRRELWEMR